MVDASFGMDINIEKLMPWRQRKVLTSEYTTLIASIRTVGLIDPLCVYKKQDDEYLIIDGYMRFLALSELQIKTVPCLVLDRKDLYTPNQQVQSLSHGEKQNCLIKASRQLGRKRVLQAFGDKIIPLSAASTSEAELHADVVKYVKSGAISSFLAAELGVVCPERQARIIKIMSETGDSSASFVRRLILNTPSNERSVGLRKSPWNKNAAPQKTLAGELAKVEKQHDFYAALYRKYTMDLLSLVVFVREIINTQPLRVYLESSHPQQLSSLRKFLDTEDLREERSTSSK